MCQPNIFYWPSYGRRYEKILAAPLFTEHPCSFTDHIFKSFLTSFCCFVFFFRLISANQHIFDQKLVAGGPAKYFCPGASLKARPALDQPYSKLYFQSHKMDFLPVAGSVLGINVEAAVKHTGQHSPSGVTVFWQSPRSSQTTSSHMAVPLLHTHTRHGSGLHMSLSA